MTGRGGGNGGRRRGRRKKGLPPTADSNPDTYDWALQDVLGDRSANFPPLSTPRTEDDIQDTAARFSNLALVKYREEMVPNFSDPSTMVTFYVGPEKTKFLIHKEIACKQSEVLRAAFNGPFVEGRTGTYTLEDTSSEAFRMFMDFLYAGKTIFHYHNLDPRDDLKVADEEHVSKCGVQDLYLVDLWLLADKFLINKLQNQVTDHMKRTCLECGMMVPSVFVKIYERTVDDSPLRRLAVDQCCWGPPSAYFFKDNAHFLPPEMLVDIATAYFNGAPYDVRHKKNQEIQSTSY